MSEVRPNKDGAQVKEDYLQDGSDSSAETCDPGESVDIKSDRSAAHYECQVPVILESSTRKRKIHMNAQECFEHSQTEEGAGALSSPSFGNLNGSFDPNRRLYPVIRKKPRTIHYSESSELDSGVSASQGFVGAKNMYDIFAKKQPMKPYQNPTNRNQTKSKSSPRKVDMSNQKSILAFINQSDSVNNLISDENKLCSSQERTHTNVMYSPINNIASSDTIYISDSSPSSSPCTSQTNQQAADIKNNPVVKQLFEAQKKMDSLPKKQKLKKATYQKNNVNFDKERKPSPVNFENDSFDMNRAFDSDLDDSVRFSTKPVSEGDKYGLLGSGHYPKTEKSCVNYFERLPLEVIENIFCQLPMLDLCLNSNRVCLAWNNIISDEKFVPWKKLYHKVKMDIDSSRKDVQDMMQKHDMAGPQNYLAALIRHMKNFKPVTASNMLTCLQQHKKYLMAKSLMEERLQDCVTHDDLNPWCVITVLVIVSQSVYDIQDIIRCLSVSVSQCTAVEIIECLYCIATFLYAFKLAKSSEVWSGMHYRLFYALYLYENASSASYADLQSVMSTGSGQQSLAKYSDASDSVSLTHEQLRIIKYQPPPKEIIKIVAFAGTGKTTTLVRYTQLRPQKRFLLVVYNKSVCDYAKTKFPLNVTCKTGHALAFAAVGRRYSAAGKLRNMSVYNVTQVLPSRKGDNLFVRARFVLETVDTFCSSADPFITTAHVRNERRDDKTGMLVETDHAAKMRYVEDAELLWNRMKDLHDKNVGMSHDGYLKLYQLNKPSLSSYDCILIDEAQDLTPAITDILTSQPQGKILVGDPNQQIYSFRGAVNAMDRIRADTTFYLTQSFRFGPEIAQVAASCLEVLKDVKTKTLVGSGKKGSVLGERNGQLAIICRCNFTVFAEAVKKCCFSDEKCKVAFVGGTDNFGFPMLLDMYALMLSPEDRKKENRTIKHPLIKSFSSFGALDDFANKAMDNELLGKIKIVKTYHNTLPRHIAKISSMAVRDTRQADYVFTTAHKAKGLEFSTVRVTDDFSLFQHPGAIIMGGLGILALPVMRRGTDLGDEANLLYVAVSRAKHALQMSQTLVSVLKRAGEIFHFPVLSEEMKKERKQFMCKEIGEEFKPKALTLQKKDIKLGDGSVLEGGLYSPQVLTEDGGSFAQLLGLTETDIQKTKQDST